MIILLCLQLNCWKLYLNVLFCPTNCPKPENIEFTKDFSHQSKCLSFILSFSILPAALNVFIYSRSTLCWVFGLRGDTRVLRCAEMQGEKELLRFFRKRNYSSCFSFFFFFNTVRCCISGWEYEEGNLSAVVQRRTWDQSRWAPRLHRRSAETRNSSGNNIKGETCVNVSVYVYKYVYFCT